MSLRLIILFANFIFLGCSCQNEVQIVGKWKRESNSDSVNQNLITTYSWGNLNFKTDSTFIISADQPENELTDTIPDGETDVSLKGTWRIEENFLLFFFEDLPTHFPQRYQIIQLTNRKLKLASPFENQNISMNLNYTRIR